MENVPPTRSLSVSDNISDNICNIQDAVSATDNVLLIISLYLSMIIALGYGLLLKRKREFYGCHKPSLAAVPVNLLHSTPERLVYVLMFGAISGELLISIVTNGYGFTKAANSSIGGVTANTAFIMLLISLGYYPAFASIRAPIPLLGYWIGFFYCCLLFCSAYQRTITAIEECFGRGSSDTMTVGYIVIVSIAPVSLSHILVLGWFVWRIVAETVRLCLTKKPKLEALYELPVERYSSNRVKWLLSKWPKDSGGNNLEPVGSVRIKLGMAWRKIRKYLYRNDPHFHFPLRFLAAVIIMVYIVYILTLFMTTVIFVYVFPVVRKIADFSDEIQAASHVLDGLDFNGTDFDVAAATVTIYDIVRSTGFGLAVVLPIGPPFSFLACVVLLLQMMATVRVHLLKIAKGNYAFLPKKLLSPSYRLVYSMQFLGFQIGYFTWAWILLTASVWLAGLAGLILYFLFKFFFNVIIRIFIALVVPILYSFGIYYFQLIFAKIFFVGDTNNKHVVINNLRFFHWFTYLMVFQNAVVGITSAFIRILYSMLFGLLLLFRLDRVVLMKGFERFDKGHKSYIGFLYLEHTLNNPALLVFSELLLKSQRTKYPSVDEKFSRDHTLPLTMAETWTAQSKGEATPRCSKQALNRWKVCYTLLRNPALQKFTASNLKTSRNVYIEETRPSLGQADDSCPEVVVVEVEAEENLDVDVDDTDPRLEQAGVPEQESNEPQPTMIN